MNRNFRESNSAISKRYNVENVPVAQRETIVIKQVASPQNDTPKIDMKDFTDLQELVSMMREKFQYVPHVQDITNLGDALTKLAADLEAKLSSGNFKGEIDNIRASLTELTNLKKPIQILKGEIDSLKKIESEVGDLKKNVNLLRDKPQVQQVIQKVEGKSYDGDISDLKRQLGELLRLVNEHRENAKTVDSKLTTVFKMQESSKRASVPGISQKDNYVSIGPDFNMPKLPPVVEKAGVFQEAPVSLAVSGGIVLHNIGYKDKRDPNKHALLCIDKTTGKVYYTN